MADVDIVGDNRFRFTGNIIWMASECTAHCAMYWTPTDSGRKRGWPKKTWW